MLTYAARAAFACVSCLMSLSCVTACTDSRAILALRPDFEVMTPAGIASVSIRQPPLGVTDAEFTQMIRTGMARAGYRTANAGRIDAPYPVQRIVWHVNRAIPSPVSRVVVNVFDGTNPYAYEEGIVSNDATPARIIVVVESMSERLLRDMAVQAKARTQAIHQASTDRSSGGS